MRVRGVMQVAIQLIPIPKIISKTHVYIYTVCANPCRRAAEDIARRVARRNCGAREFAPDLIFFSGGARPRVKNAKIIVFFCVDP